MKKLASHIASLSLLLALLAPARPQQPPAQPQSQPAPAQTQEPRDRDDEVVRITTNLVQVDAVVVDKKGRQVTDLRPEEFEVLEDGRPQTITNFSYVSTGAAAAASPEARPTPADASAPPAPPVRLRPEQVRRTVALVVDDLGLAFDSVHWVRRALKKFVDEQMQPDDLVAIIRTSAGVGALQQFTSDKRQLYAAIERVRYYMSGRGGLSAFSPVEGSRRFGGGPAREGGGSDEDEGGRQDDAGDELDDFREEIISVGTLGALNYVVRGMRELPGRKSVVLFSDGFQLFSPDRGRGRSDRVLQAVRRLTDLANRASVVFYTLDARGLVYTGPTAADDFSGMSPDQIAQTMSRRGQRLFETQDGPNYLAVQTGGFAVRNSNDLSSGVRRALEDQAGYYLIGYRPRGETFDRRFHRIDVRVKRPGLSVRARKGFYGVSDEEARPVRRTREQQLLAALTSPLGAGGVRLKLTGVFGHAPQTGSYVHAMMHVDARDLKFEREPDGTYKTVIDVLGVAFGDNGWPVEQGGRTQTLRVRPDAYESLLRNGLVYTFNVRIKKPGAYQLRMAVRDAATERVGSASQFVEVPDLKKNRLALSGLVVVGNRQAGVKNAGGAAGAAAAPAPAEGAVETPDPQASPAVRQFRQRMPLDFGYVVFNAKTDKANPRPRLTSHTRLYRDGQIVFEGKPQPINSEQATDPKLVVSGGRLLLGTNLTPGEYVLQVVVTDDLAKGKHRTAAQWIDFEIVK